MVQLICDGASGGITGVSPGTSSVIPEGNLWRFFFGVNPRGFPDRNPRGIAEHPQKFAVELLADFLVELLDDFLVILLEGFPAVNPR